MSKWTKFREKWKACKECPLHEVRDRIVLARGKLPCDVLFIGEAPGKSENAIGKPFIGKAGKLLDQIIREALTTERYALTNLISCIPLERKGGDKVEEPPKESIEACNDRLNEFVRLCNPSVVVLVGKHAKKYIYGQDQFGGKWSHKNISGVFIDFVEIVHPAAILRMNITARPLEVKRCVVAIRDACERIIPF